MIVLFFVKNWYRVEPWSFHNNSYWNLINFWLELQLCFLIVSLSMYQCTPLHFAAREGYVGIVRWLVGKGADIKIQDSDGVSTYTCEIILLPVMIHSKL